MNFFTQEIIQKNFLQNKHKDKFSTFVHVIIKECFEKLNICIKELLDNGNLATNALKGALYGIEKLQYIITFQSQVNNQMIP
jgi:hypothetical protein